MQRRQPQPITRATQIRTRRHACAHARVLAQPNSCAPSHTYRHKPHATRSHSETTPASYETPRYQDVHTQRRTTLHITRTPPPPPRPLQRTNKLRVDRHAIPLRQELSTATPAPAGGTGAARRTVLSQRRHTKTYTATQAAAHTRTRKSMHAQSGQPVTLVLDTADGGAAGTGRATRGRRKHRHVRRPNTRRAIGCRVSKAIVEFL